MSKGGTEAIRKIMYDICYDVYLDCGFFFPMNISNTTKIRKIGTQAILAWLSLTKPTKKNIR